MQRSILSCVPLALALVLASVSTGATEPGNKQSVTVSFGRGLNTNQPGNPANHHVVPQRIKVKAGGVVNFVVAGFHQIFVYLPGRGPGDIVVPPAPALFINDLAGIYYQGPAPNVPPANPAISNAQNRVESVSFDQPGRYLVLCNVRPHFLDGMWAIVEVEGDDDN
jgi:plastocyanin